MRVCLRVCDGVTVLQGDEKLDLSEDEISLYNIIFLSFGANGPDSKADRTTTAIVYGDPTNDERGIGRGRPWRQFTFVRYRWVVGEQRMKKEKKSEKSSGSQQNVRGIG